MTASAVYCLLSIVALTSAAIQEDAATDQQYTQETYNILMLLPLSSRSHRTLFLILAEELAERGHKVELLVNHPRKSTHPNISEIYHGLPHFQEKRHQLFEARDHPWELYELLMNGLPEMTKALYNLSVVQDLYKRRKQFDLVIIDNFYNQMMYPFAYELPLAMMVASGVDPIQSAIMGNVINPSYSPALQVIVPQPMSLCHRAINVAAHIVTGFFRQYLILPKIQAEISKVFPDLPPLRDIERNQSLALLNYCFSFEITLPLLPSQIDIGGLHCRPGQPLSQDLEEWVNGAGDAGVVYFSLGSVAMGTSLPLQWRDLFIRAFSKLKQRVVWKFEGELLGISDNVLVRKWLPQQDLLAHPQVKLFISHGGMLSSQEAVYHTTPILALPIIGDQPKNAHLIHMAQLGISLEWEDLTESLLISTIETIISNKMYAENMALASKILRDQPQLPKDRASFWIEYVIRHRGASHLKTPGAHLSWIEFIMLDVAIVISLTAAFFFFILFRVFRSLLGIICGNKTSKIKGLKED